MKQNRFTVRKFDGDTAECWAVFRKVDVKGICGIVFRGQAQPVVCGCSKRTAEFYRSKCDAGFYEKSV